MASVRSFGWKHFGKRLEQAIGAESIVYFSRGVSFLRDQETVGKHLKVVTLRGIETLWLSQRTLVGHCYSSTSVEETNSSSVSSCSSDSLRMKK
jgi:hypothetical protein